MTVDTPEVAAARIEAERARARFMESLWALETPILELKRQLTPSHIMSDAWEGAKEKGAGLAEDAVDAVKARPLAATGVVAAITMFLAREPLMDLAGQLLDRVKNKRKTRKPRPKPKVKAKASDTEAVHG
jgi:hypothetical protein